MKNTNRVSLKGIGVPLLSAMLASHSAAALAARTDDVDGISDISALSADTPERWDNGWTLRFDNDAFTGANIDHDYSAGAMLTFRGKRAAESVLSLGPARARLDRLSGFKRRYERSGGTTQRHALQNYMLLNNLILMAGLVLLAVLFRLEAFEPLSAILLAVGVFFFLQLSPLAIPGIRNLLSDLSQGLSQHDDQQGRPRAAGQLFDFVSPALVGIASLLFITYLITEVLRWSGYWDTQLLKIIIYVTSNLFFAAVIAAKLYSLKRSTDEDYATRLRDLRKIAPAFVYISIGISVYFFGKQLLFDFDMQELRPIMMSAFLQMLAILVFDKTLSGR